MSEDIKKIDRPDDPRRCQGTTGTGQCNNLAVEGGTVCNAHGGNKQTQAIATKSLSIYRIGQFQAKLDAKINVDDVKSLRDEIAVLRMIMEELINRCQSTAELITFSGRIGDMAMKIEKLVSSCHGIEKSMGKMLDKTALLQFASEIINILGTELKGQEPLLNKISDQIIGAIGRTSTMEQSTNKPN